jgi:hypothetical protein
VVDAAIGEKEYERYLRDQVNLQIGLDKRIARIEDQLDSTRLWVIVLAFASGGTLIYSILRGGVLP